MGGDQPEHWNDSDPPTTDIEDLLIAEAIAQLPPVSEGQELRNGGNTSHYSELQVREVEIPEHIQGEIGS